VCLQTTEGTRSIVYFYKMITLGKLATADAMMDALQSQFVADGQDFVKYLKECLVGYVSDSAAVMVGPINGLKQKFDAWIGRRFAGALLPLCCVVCMAHRLHWKIQSAFCPEDRMDIFRPFSDFEQLLNGIYNFFKRSTRRIGEFRERQEALDTQSYKPTYLYTNRWISSEHSTVRRARQSYFGLRETFYAYMNDVSTDNSEATKMESSRLHEKLLDKNFVILLHYIEDFTGIFQKYSRILQQRTSLLTGSYKLIEDLVLELDMIERNEGPVLTAILKALRTSEDIQGATGLSIAEYEEAPLCIGEARSWGFSLFNVIKDDRRSGISDDHLDSLLQIKINTPEDTDEFNPDLFAKVC